MLSDESTAASAAYAFVSAGTKEMIPYSIVTYRFPVFWMLLRVIVVGTHFCTYAGLVTVKVGEGADVGALIVKVGNVTPLHPTLLIAPGAIVNWSPTFKVGPNPNVTMNWLPFTLHFAP